MHTEAGVILIGAGGHAKVVADALLKSGFPRDRIEFFDQNTARVGDQILGIPVSLLQFPTLAGKAVHVCVGDNAKRRQLAESARQAGATLVTVVHPAACIGEEVVLGAGVFVAAQAVIAPGVSLGEGTIINHGAIVDHDCRVGDFCHVAPQSSLAGGVNLGNGVLIGAGANVLPRVVIGDNAVVGAGAAVIVPVPEGRTVVGVPAGRQI